MWCVSNAKLGRTAIAANLRGGHLVVTVGEAQAYGGVIRGSLATCQFRARRATSNRSCNSPTSIWKVASAQLFGLRRLEGKGNISLARRRHRRQRACGDAHAERRPPRLIGTNGALAGLNVEQLLRRLERRPLSGGGEFRSGRTPYDKITVALKIGQGTVTVEDVKIEGTHLPATP